MKQFYAIFALILFCFFPWNLTAQENDEAQEAETLVISGQDTLNDTAAEVSNSRIDGANLSEATLLETLTGEITKIETKLLPEPLLKSLTQRLFFAFLIVAAQAFFIWLIWFLFKKLSVKISHTGGTKIKPLTIKKFKILSAKQITGVILFFVRILKYFITAFQLFITLPIVFSLFPQTKNIASILFGYILTPVKRILLGFVQYIPNLITIVIIIVITRYVLKALKFFAGQISRGRLTIPGFYAEWAEPTYKILQVLLMAFMLAIVFPYLPNSESKVFQGVSVFIGVIFSLGSTTAIGNLVAGLVITYMRPFKIGDRVQIKETIGFVVEKNLMVVRIKTHKNEYVTFPNLLILGSNIINYNTSTDEDEEGLILHTEVTFGYSTPWQTIHEILINAALETEHVQKRPMPYVLQTGLDDFYARYQINCYTKHVDKIPRIYTNLNENIQEGFIKAGIDPTAAHHFIVDELKSRKTK